MMYLFNVFICVLVALNLIVAGDHADGISPYGDGFAPDVTLGTGWNDSFPDVESGASALDFVDEEDDTSNSTEIGADLARRGAKDFYLRVMPLGASITQGITSSDGNGYRKWLRSQLRWKGWRVNMVGSKMDGNMADKDNEGHPGWVITQIHTAFQQSKWMMPNLVLINAGTNDCNGNVDPNHAADRLKIMIDDIFNSIPGVTVIVSTLVPSRDNNTCASAVSEQYRSLVRSQYSGSRMEVADINAALPLSMLSSDGVHPNDEGYKLFAAVWWDAVRKVENVIQPPANVASIDDSSILSGGNTCAKVAGNARGPIQSQLGSGHDDGIYVHNRIERGALKSARIDKWGDPKNITDNIPWHMFFANLVVGDPNFDRKDALDDWIRVYHDTRTGKNTYYFRQNLGGGNFGPSTTFDVAQDCDLGPHYAFADFNNDGYDDFYCLKQGSAVAVSLNRGGNPPKFEYIGQVVPTHAGYTDQDVRIADIDGDGRADYCLTQSNGHLVCSRNGGVDDNYFWQGFSTENELRGTVFDKRTADPAGVYLGDINRDYRTDYLYIGDNGNVETWINSRGWNPGIVPSWRSAGLTHPGQAASDIRGNIKFGRIYGSGRLDYIYLHEDDTGYDVRVWENTGSGGTRRKADGNFYCDMRGTGADDYVWIYFDGHAAEINANIHDPPYWGHSTTITLSVPGPRVGIHLADWTGDGKCDVLVQNKATGALTLYENRFDASKNSLTFANRGVVTGATCSQGWGVGIFDRGMRLADIDGDKRADVLCLEKDGRVTAWLNTNSGLSNVGQIKFSEGWDRANMRFADVEGSGRADLIHLDKYTGAAKVFKNNGHTPGGSGSSFSWTNRGVLYSPIDRGETMHFTNQGGIGRADLLHVLPVSNRAYTYFNECGGGSGGDDGLIEDPHLPSYDTGGGIEDPGNGNTPGAISTDGRCGPNFNNARCIGSLFGACCSFDGHCGGDGDHCGSGCQWDFGLCRGTGDDEEGGGGNGESGGGGGGDSIWTPEIIAEVCGYKFNNLTGDPLDPMERSYTWIASSAATWFLNFLNTNGAKNWSNKFFQAVIANGTQGGSTYDCIDMGKHQCPGPVNKECKTYTPPPAFYVHIQMGNLYGAYTKLWGAMVEDGIKNLASGIKEIVEEYGTPPKDENSGIVDMLVGIMTSLLGLAVERDPALEGPMTFLADIMEQLKEEDEIDPGELNDELEVAYGKMFSGVMASINGTGSRIFSGTLPDGWEGSISAEDWVWTRFANGQWLDAKAVSDTVDTYVENTQFKFKEFAVITAMKTGNSGWDYFLLSGDRCICFGRRSNRGGSIPLSSSPLKGDDLETFQGYVQDYDKALLNNYDCVKWILDHKDDCFSFSGAVPEQCHIPNATIPERKDLNLQEPQQYTDCWFNLATLSGDQFGGCAFSSDCDGAEYCSA